MFLEIKDCNQSIQFEIQKFDKYDKSNDLKKAKLEFFLRLNRIGYSRI